MPFNCGHWAQKPLKSSNHTKLKRCCGCPARTKRLAGDTDRAANNEEVTELRREGRDLKEVVAELTLENRLLKKSMIGDGGEGE